MFLICTNKGNDFAARLLSADRTQPKLSPKTMRWQSAASPRATALWIHLSSALISSKVMCSETNQRPFATSSQCPP